MHYNSLAHGLVVLECRPTSPADGFNAVPPCAVVPLKGRLQGGAVGGARVQANVSMRAGMTYVLALSSLTLRDISDGHANGSPPAVDQSTAPPSTDLVGAAVELASSAARNLTSLRAEHQQWWEEYWRTGAAVVLGEKRLDLEGWWYGSQYLFGSAVRPGKVAPGLWGPWVTGGKWVNWNGERPRVHWPP
jgi:hypothetical protein